MAIQMAAGAAAVAATQAIPKHSTMAAIEAHTCCEEGIPCIHVAAELSSLQLVHSLPLSDLTCHFMSPFVGLMNSL